MADYAIDLYVDGGTVHGGVRVSGFSTRTTAGEAGAVLADALRNHFGADTHFTFVGSPSTMDPYAHLSVDERRYLAMHARYEAERQLDPRNYAAGPHPDGGQRLDERWHTRQERADRWREIADGLYPNAVEATDASR